MVLLSLLRAFLLVAGRACARSFAGAQFIPELMVTAACVYSIIALKKGKVADDDCQSFMSKNRMLAGFTIAAVFLAMPVLQTIAEGISGQVGEYLPELMVASAVTFWLYQVRSRPIQVGVKKSVSPPPSPKLACKSLSSPQLPQEEDEAEELPLTNEDLLGMPETPETFENRLMQEMVEMIEHD